MTTDEQIEALGGCQSHACLIAPPKGMGTNAAKCYCDEQKVKRALRLRNKQVAAAQERAGALSAEIDSQVAGMREQLLERLVWAEIAKRIRAIVAD
jgi:hypothetical protein